MLSFEVISQQTEVDTEFSEILDEIIKKKKKSEIDDEY